MTECRKDVDEAWAVRQVLRVELRAVILLLERGHLPAALEMLRGMQGHEEYPWTDREAALDALAQAKYREA